MSTFSINKGPTIIPYRPPAYTPQPVATQPPPPPPRPNISDDYERWYTEPTHNNRMVLSICSGIDSEISWALDRLCRLCNNEQFVLKAIPGLMDALFEWPQWYVIGLEDEAPNISLLFSTSPYLKKKQRHALESMFVLRNSAINQPNAHELSAHPRTRSLILRALHKIQPDTDTNVEFLLYIIELLVAISPLAVLPPIDAHILANPIPPLEKIAGTSSNRSLIMASLTSLSILLSNPSNAVHLTADSSALAAVIRYLPLFADKPLVAVGLDYLYSHLSHPPMSKAFLLHPDMAATLRLLVTLLLSEQVEEQVTLDIGGPVHTAPVQMDASTSEYVLTQEELDRLYVLPEPQRCFEWMRTMFVSSPEGELTQVDFWNMYKNAFEPFQDHYRVLVASDVIKNVSLVFPQALAMVLPGPPQKFIVRGVDRRRRKHVNEQLQCRWDRSQCPTEAFESAGELYEHVLSQHVNPHEGAEISCSWAACAHSPLSKTNIRGHVLTHLPSTYPPVRYPLQSDTITLPSLAYPYPTSDPTNRPVPPPRSTTITYTKPVLDPPSSSLTALLCIRILFRASFASSDTAPRVDEDHFGFPGILEEPEEDGIEERIYSTANEKEGERRGRKAFLGVRNLLEGVRIRDETLMGWITEMGLTPTPKQDETKFWTNLLQLELDHEYLSGRLNSLSKEVCLGRAKPLLNVLVATCLQFIHARQYDDVKTVHAVETLSVASRCILGMNLAGWEVMEIFAGDVNSSDKFFDELTTSIDQIMSDASSPALADGYSVDIRHKSLQLSVIFVCGISQLSPGAYFLRRDFFPAVVSIVTSPETEQFTFEAALLVTILANYHKSDAAKLNPYLRSIHETENRELMRKLCWASNFAVDSTIKAYQNISDDSLPTVGTIVTSFLTSLRPDRVLSSTPLDPPHELFKNQPIEACVILLSVYEFMRANATFQEVIMEPLTTDSKPSGHLTPLPYTLITLSSYLLTHASSTSSSRAMAYANLSLNTLLVMVESDRILRVLCQLSSMNIRLCRQRLPHLPLSSLPRAPVCALLDCCILWLRHNLQKRLEVYHYIMCIRICYKVLWYLQREHVRLEYHWQEFWRAIIGVLDFVVNKQDSLISTGGIELLVRQVIALFDLALDKAEIILPTPKAMQEFVYELVRDSKILKKQQDLLHKLALPPSLSSKRLSTNSNGPTVLEKILAMTSFYEEKIHVANSRSAAQALSVVAREIDKDGLRYSPTELEDPPTWAEDVVGFIRYACIDGMALMP